MGMAIGSMRLNIILLLFFVILLFIIFYGYSTFVRHNPKYWFISYI